MTLRNILLLYRVRLRARLAQELFAVLGIAVGVALLFGSQIASTSLNDSMSQLLAGIVGNMRLQLAARSPQGFDQRLLGQVLRLPGVDSALPALAERASVIGPGGRQPVELISSDPRFASQGGPLTRRFAATQLERQQIFAVPLPIAQSVGLSSLQPAELQVGGHVARSFLGAALLQSEIGSLVHAPVAIAALAYAQHLAGVPGRLTSIYVQPRPGRAREVRAGLVRLAAGRLNVQPANFEALAFRQAAGPANQSALLFSTISALVGFLFAFNAMLLTVPQRRHLVEDLRLDGYARRMIVEVLLFDALVLGVVASLLGLLLGDLLSLVLFRANPGYLSFAFALGSQRIVTWQSAVVAVGGGLLAACVGVLMPLRAGIFSSLTLTISATRSRHGRTGAALIGGAVCLAITTAILLVAPRHAIVGIASLIGALLAFLPYVIGAIVLVCDRLQRSFRGAAAHLAVVELRSGASQPRSLAIAATGAIAVFGSVAIAGAQANLQHGLDRATRELDRPADIWVSPADPSNALATTPFAATATAALARLPGIRAVDPYRGSFLDFGDRRIWVLGLSSAVAEPIPSSQLVRGDLRIATERLRAGGWAVVSEALAAEHNLEIGQAFTLPAPRPISLRVAALSTNIGWSPGAIILNADDYARGWDSGDISAYNIQLEPGAQAGPVSREIRRALGPRSDFAVETARQRERLRQTDSRQGLSRLTQIATLVLLAAVLAMAAAMGAVIWQRRPRLADMKVDGFARGVLWRALLIESLLLLGTGCSAGAVFGVYGQVLLSHALATVTGFPVVFSIGAIVAISSFLLVTAVAVSIVAVPGYLAARVRPSIILQE
jgi:putative ABC transport system permease protein